MTRSVGVLALETKFIAWWPALQAGLIGGCAYLIMQFLWSSLATGSDQWMWFRMAGAIALGRDALLTVDVFDPLVTLVALLVHFWLSLVYAVVLAFVLSRWSGGAPRWSGGVCALIGAVFGVLLYAVNYYGFTGWFPWFGELRHAVTIANNLAFGAVTALAYWYLARPARAPQ
jgi:hypothetical protein